MTRCLKMFFEACKARGLDGFSMKAVRAEKVQGGDDLFEVFHDFEHLGFTRACCAWRAKDKFLVNVAPVQLGALPEAKPKRVRRTKKGAPVEIEPFAVPEGWTNLGSVDPAALARGAREVYTAHVVRLVVQDGTLYLGVADCDLVEVGPSCAPDGDYGSISPKFLAQVGGACNRTRLDKPIPQPKLLKGMKRVRPAPKARFAPAVEVELCHKDDKLIIAAGGTRFNLEVPRQDLSYTGDYKYKRSVRYHEHHDQRPYQEIAAAVEAA